MAANFKINEEMSTWKRKAIILVDGDGNKIEYKSYGTIVGGSSVQDTSRSAPAKEATRTMLVVST